MESYGKNVDSARSSYIQAVKSYESGDFDTALRYISETLHYAPDKCPSSAQAYGLRATIALKQEQGEQAVHDLRRAIEGQTNHIECEEEKDNLAFWKSQLVKAMRRMSKTALEPHYEKQSLFSGESSLYYGVSSSIKMEQDPKKGRKFVALTPIPAGSLLVREIPVGWSLDERFTHALCQYCCDTLPIDWVPCHTCSQTDVRFCSDICRDLAWNEFHKYECAAVNNQQLNYAYTSHIKKSTIIDDDKVWINQRRAAMRVLLKTPISDLQVAEVTMKTLEAKHDFGMKADDGFGSNIKSTLSLMPLTINTEDRLKAIQVIEANLPATFIESPEWKQGRPIENVSEYVAKLLLNIQLRLARNAVSLHVLTPDGQSESRARGSGLYPLVAMFNHRLDVFFRPNVEFFGQFTMMDPWQLMFHKIY